MARTEGGPDAARSRDLDPPNCMPLNSVTKQELRAVGAREKNIKG
jgi:hypothetical protein